MEKLYINELSIDHRPKGIPYGPGVRDDGTENFGFKNLKGELHRLSEIPELAEDPALFDLVSKINKPETGLLTIGCVSGPVIKDDRGFHFSGYVEFAFNDADKIADAAHYFPVFFHWDRGLDGDKFSQRVRFDWRLKPAHFADANVGGFTAIIVINTAFLETEAAARIAWNTALDWLGDYLASVPDEAAPGRRLYPRERKE
ncbi:hypothetical protein [Mesorhizobium sp. M1D.F.Ca.ET.043.01.1.1]|uniref:hypothetical protein n=1 Tax=Mesorhizobium sp. M1D.F.Ca.ET.043.01.1.1 TaxID=2493669 RepID=UPI000F75D35A|nr:hypothetical protein [Mesorhizobium sp. M1D.F.Ca.ET.043.01.1.1]AZO69955.1 hypothetical protein EJ067_01215 [Mesorhizobium sp. M1D.F.Ca.ET.043.01.1.1]